MDTRAHTSWIAFAHAKCIASGTPREVATAVQACVDTHNSDDIQIFDAVTSRPVNISLLVSLSAAVEGQHVPETLEPAPDTALPSATARTLNPKPLINEITLLPRHWEWLAAQPGGAAVTLRKLVEQARHTNREADLLRETRESVYRFMAAMAGNESGYEDATRALFAGDLVQLQECVATWPSDIRNHTLSLARRTETTGMSESDA